VHVCVCVFVCVCVCVCVCVRAFDCALQQLQQRLGGWKEYLDALRKCWEPVFGWYAAGTLTTVG
jgi:hypothetical protein